MICVSSRLGALPCAGPVGWADMYGLMQAHIQGVRSSVADVPRGHVGLVRLQVVGLLYYVLCGDEAENCEISLHGVMLGLP